jgi:hypothetical protein
VLDTYGRESSSLFGQEPDRIASLTPGQIAAAAGRWLAPEHLAIVAVGPASALTPALSRFGAVEVVHLPAPAAPVSMVDTTAVTADNLAAGGKIVDQAIEAHGGKSALLAIHDSAIDMTVQVGTGGLGGTGKLRQVRREPSQLSSVTTYREFQARQVLNGDHGWSVSGTESVVEADSQQVESMRASFDADLPHLLLALRPASGIAPRVVAHGPDRIEQRDVVSVEARMANGRYRRYFFDAKTHLLSAIDLFEGVPGDNGLHERRLYGGYKEVGGVLWPYREQRVTEGRPPMRIQTDEVLINVGASDRDFEKPGATNR